MNTVELEHVTKTFGPTVAVDDLCLVVPEGSIYGFIGPNGSGKTTTLRMIVNIFYPDRGAVRVFGEPRVGACLARIGYLPEERGLYRRMKVREILRFYGELRTGRRFDADIERWLAQMNLGEHANKRIEALSKGTSQKVQFLAAVVPRPDLLILDEPFSGLDPVNAEVLRAAVLELRRQGTTIVLSTHDMAVAESMCDFIFMIFEGRKVLDGTLASIQNQYGHDTLRVRVEHKDTLREGLPGVDAVRDLGQVQELRLARQADPQAVLRAMLARTRLWSFDLAKPSLHDIFLRIAGPPGQPAEPPGSPEVSRA